MSEAVRPVRLSYELSPHFGNHSDDDISRVAEAYAERLRPIAGQGLEGVNNPEIVRYSHSRLEYLNGDVRKLARSVADNLGVEATVSKNVTYLSSESRLLDYIHETIPDKRIRNITFVGGSFSSVKYPGPTVARANEVARKKATEHNVRIGNIAIFHREDEDLRMFAKTRSGADFFVSQLEFEIDYTVTTLKSYGNLCEKKGVKPATVYISFAPLLFEEDVSRYRKLLRDGDTLLPKEVAETILRENGDGRIAKSVENADKIWSTVQKHIKNVPLGVHVEQIKEHNIDGAIQMATHFAGVLRDRELAPEEGLHNR